MRYIKPKTNYTVRSEPQYFRFVNIRFFRSKCTALLNADYSSTGRRLGAINDCLATHVEIMVC